MMEFSLEKEPKKLLNLVNKTEAEMTSDNETISGDIYIGGGETEGMRLITKAIKETQKIHPEIKFHLYSGNAQDVTEKLDKGLLDFGILIEPELIFQNMILLSSLIPIAGVY